MNMPRFALVMAILTVAWLAAACDEPENLQTDTQTVTAGAAERVNVELEMGAGELRLASATQDALLDATFRYNRPRLKPEVDYHVSGATGLLRVGRRHTGFSFGHVRNEWDLRLGRSLPVDLRVNLGAGESKLDLRGLQISGVDIDMGVGEMTLDLQGPHAKSFDVKINGGVGSGRIYLPADVGVRARVQGGIGSVDVHGLSKHGRVYTNEAYGKSAVTVDIDINAGIGSLDLRVEPAGRAKL
ncbi:MAG: toast rack family protein [Candidatus Aminicenantales bacterium]